MSIGYAREILVNLCSEWLGARVEPYRIPETIVEPTILVRLGDITPLPEAPAAGYRQYSAELMCLSEHLDPEVAATQVDALVELLLEQIEYTGDLVWTRVQTVALDQWICRSVHVILTATATVI